MTSFITQCPHCRTSFRVSRAQLGAAHGVVRCGACLELFSAAQCLQKNAATDTDSLLLPRPADTPPTMSPAPTETSAKSAADQETLWIHDDLDLDDLDLDEELAKLEEQERELSRQLQQLEQPQPDDHLQPPTDHDEAWAERLLDAENERAASQARNAEPLQHAADQGSSWEKLSFTPVTPDAPVPPSPLAMTDQPLADAREQEPRPERIEPALGEVGNAFDEAPEAALPIEAPEPAESDHQTHADQAPDKPLFELDDEPLQLDWQARRKPWGRWLGWGALNLIALLALAGQYVAYNFDELARDDDYRPWFAQLCPAIGCTLPPKVDIEQIKSSNLVVRSHPDFNAALVVDAIIYNRASFAQPFPLLEIRFADINGQPLASRTFKPGEYLSGELAGRTEMPPQVPIHIALDILDPGAEAVNYSLGFHSPE